MERVVDVSELDAENKTPAAPGSEAVTTPTFLDPALARLLLRSLTVIAALIVIIAVMLGLLGFMYWRRPDRVVIKEDPNGSQVLFLNDRQYGAVANLALKPDQPSSGEKKFAAKEFASLLYEFDVTSRAKAIERAFALMLPASALKLRDHLKQQLNNPNNNLGIALETERREVWQGTFKPQDIALDARDPFTVNIIGEQQITRVFGGQGKRESKQIALAIKLVADPEGRQDRNLQTGFLVLAFDYKELPK